jgi:hypothetical protein
MALRARLQQAAARLEDHQRDSAAADSPARVEAGTAHAGGDEVKISPRRPTPRECVPNLFERWPECDDLARGRPEQRTPAERLAHSVKSVLAREAGGKEQLLGLDGAFNDFLRVTAARSVDGSIWVQELCAALEALDLASARTADFREDFGVLLFGVLRLQETMQYAACAVADAGSSLSQKLIDAYVDADALLEALLLRSRPTAYVNLESGLSLTEQKQLLRRLHEKVDAICAQDPSFRRPLIALGLSACAKHLAVTLGAYAAGPDAVAAVRHCDSQWRDLAQGAVEGRPGWSDQQAFASAATTLAPCLHSQIRDGFLAAFPRPAPPPNPKVVERHPPANDGSRADVTEKRTDSSDNSWQRPRQPYEIAAWLTANHFAEEAARRALTLDLGDAALIHVMAHEGAWSDRIADLLLIDDEEERQRLASLLGATLGPSIPQVVMPRTEWTPEMVADSLSYLGFSHAICQIALQNELGGESLSLLMTESSSWCEALAETLEVRDVEGRAKLRRFVEELLGKPLAQWDLGDVRRWLRKQYLRALADRVRDDCKVTGPRLLVDDPRALARELGAESELQARRVARKIELLRSKSEGEGEARLRERQMARFGPRAVALVLERGEPFFNADAAAARRLRLPWRDCQRLEQAGVDGACLSVLEREDCAALGLSAAQAAKLWCAVERLRAGPDEARGEERGVRAWSEAEVGAWLTESGLDAVRPRLEEERIDGVALAELANAQARQAVLGVAPGSLLDHRFATRLTWLLEGRRDLPRACLLNPIEFLRALDPKTNGIVRRALEHNMVDGSCLDLLLEPGECERRLGLQNLHATLCKKALRDLRDTYRG